MKEDNNAQKEFLSKFGVVVFSEESDFPSFYDNEFMEEIISQIPKDWNDIQYFGVYTYSGWPEDENAQLDIGFDDYYEIRRIHGKIEVEKLKDTSLVPSTLQVEIAFCTKIGNDEALRIQMMDNVFSFYRLTDIIK